MKHYLEKIPPTTDNNYLTTWTDNPDEWKNASPIYFLDNETPPFLIMLKKNTPFNQGGE